jgi:predicted HTH domain antitoxin
MCITEYDEARTFAEQREDGALDILVNLIKKGLLTLAQAAEEAHMTVAEFEAKTGLKA